VEFFEGWEGWIGVGQRRVAECCGWEVVAASAEPDWWEWKIWISEVSWKDHQVVPSILTNVPFGSASPIVSHVCFICVEVGRQ
jgi:hypothetical protein